MAISTQLHL